MSREVYKHKLTKKECLFVVRNFKGTIGVWHSTDPTRETYLCVKTEILHPLDGKIQFTLFTDKSNCDHDFCAVELPDMIKADYEDSWKLEYP
jgi:hypothetical protein|tara:strand:+ start:101 stop:376 length:276 start_codon:yes stop_codon:yes gene_type:complete